MNPSRNVTDVADFWGERVTKLLEALKAIIPGFSRFAVVASKRDAQVQALKLRIPQEVLLRADRVIE